MMGGFDRSAWEGAQSDSLPLSRIRYAVLEAGRACRAARPVEGPGMSSALQNCADDGIDHDRYRR